MINIENSSIGLAQNIPDVILTKLKAIGFSDKQKTIEVVTISGDNVDKIKKSVDKLNGKYESLGYGFGIITIPVDKFVDLSRDPNIQYIELPKSLYASDAQSNRASCVQDARQKYNVKGEGILIGFIDSGIDFTHNAFRNDDGTTRIEYIYDLSEGGKIYNKSEINAALKNQDPFSVINFYDLQEHGTHVAGIACAGGKISEDYYGVAPKSSLAIVKCTRGKFALSTNIMRGLKFLVDKSRELSMPLVVNISLSTNDGAHNGSSLLEQYISTVAKLERITIVIAAGNEGDAAHHVGGLLDGEKDISLNIGQEETGVFINLYKSVLSQISIKVVSPTGMSSDYVQVTEGYNQGNIGRDKYEIYYTGAKPFDLLGEISIALIPRAKYLSTGEWSIVIKLTNEYRGLFDMWLPVSEGLNISTKFLQPTVLNTLGIPATVSNIIAVGSYNYLNNNISSFSGRGRPVIYEAIRPDIVAPGEGIISAIPNNSFDKKSGTSMAAPHVSGIAALMMQVGIVRGNDPYLYGERLKYYLVTTSKKPRSDISYPDSSWGYGEVCAGLALDSLSQTLGFDSSSDERFSNNNENIRSSYEEYELGGIFIRRPKKYK